MCGVTGFWDFRHHRNLSQNNQALLSMTQALQSRGPDSSGIWRDEQTGVYIGHTRLAIQDLSEHGAQPMASESHRFILSYNGEVYNTADFKEELITKGHTFKGHSDTEVILAACEAWGIEKACQKFIGMFAFVLWDKQERCIYIARDRVGIKPLYWGFNNDILYFGSQLKSFLQHPHWQAKVNNKALEVYLKLNYITAPYSIYQDIYKLNPGTFIRIDAYRQTKEIKFWHPADFKPHNFSQTSEEITESLENLLNDAVSKRMIADVPLGAFLSGGIDSSLVVSLMQKNSIRPVKTFSIGFYEGSFNEAKHAKKVAQHLGTSHEEVYLSPQESMEVIPQLSDYYDEPFADVSQIPTYLVSKLARQHVKVSLSGDGGDELFLGYDRYIIGKKLQPFYESTPACVRKGLARLLKIISPSQWQKITQLAPKQYQFSQIAEKAYKLSDVLTSQSESDFYQSLVSIWNHPEKIMTSFPGNIEIYSQQMLQHFEDPMLKMSYLDLHTYLPEDILTKVDRASMALGLEARVPLLDHRVIEFAYQLPAAFKYKGQTKFPLRQVLYKYVPRELIERPKMGFSVPIGEWLRGPLRQWAEDLLSHKSLTQRGFFKPELIQEKWQDHLEGKINFQYPLWGILMFQQWAEKYNAHS